MANNYIHRTIEAKLDEADFVAENETRRYSHDEVFSRLRGKING